MRKPDLARAEWIIMQAVWKAVSVEPEVTVSEILPEIYKKKGWHVSTLKTTMDRLVKKGFLTSRVRGKTCFYAPAFSRDQVTKKSLGSFLDDVLDGMLSPLVAYLADRKKLSSKDIEKLEELLHEKK